MEGSIIENKKESDGTKWWKGLNSELKTQFTKMAFKEKISLELTPGEIDSLFIIAKDHTRALPLDVKHLSEYVKYMQENGWWDNK